MTKNYWRTRIDRAEDAAAYRFLGVVISIPLPSVARAARTFNTIERQILSAFSGNELRLQARSIAASLPVRTAEGRAQSQAIRDALEVDGGPDRSDLEIEQAIRAASIDGLTLLNRVRDEPQETEAVLIRVAMWLTVVGLAATYVLSVAFGDITNALIAGALGGMLGSLSNLLLHHKISLGMIVLSPVAGALNATGGLLLVSFLAQNEIQVLGEVFQQAWIRPTSLTSLAVALLLGFFGGMFARIAVAGAAPLLGTNGDPAKKPTSDSPGTETAETPPLTPDNPPSENLVDRSVTGAKTPVPTTVRNGDQSPSAALAEASTTPDATN